MDSEYVTNNEHQNFYASNPPRSDEWQCYLFGSQECGGLVFHPIDGKHPNFFWRFMQYICFGNKWVRIKK